MYRAEDTGIFAELRAREARIVAANPHLERRITGRTQVVYLKSTKRPPRVIVERKLPRASVPPARQIVLAVAKAWEIEPHRLQMADKTVRVTRPRFAAYRLLVSNLGLSTPAVGRILGGRDHTTVLYGLKRAQHLHDHDADWRARYDRAVASLEAGEAS